MAELDGIKAKGDNCKKVDFEKSKVKVLTVSCVLMLGRMAKNCWSLYHTVAIDCAVISVLETFAVVSFCFYAIVFRYDCDQPGRRALQPLLLHFSILLLLALLQSVLPLSTD